MPLIFLLSDMQKEQARINQVLRQRRENVRRGRNGMDVYFIYLFIHLVAVRSTIVWSNLSSFLQTLLMAHALRRVSLSTARPSDSQFAFVSHNPGSADAQLYCHVFRARHARAVRHRLAYPRSSLFVPKPRGRERQ